MAGTTLERAMGATTGSISKDAPVGEGGPNSSGGEEGVGMVGRR